MKRFIVSMMAAGYVSAAFLVWGYSPDWMFWILAHGIFGCLIGARRVFNWN